MKSIDDKAVFCLEDGQEETADIYILNLEEGMFKSHFCYMYYQEYIRFRVYISISVVATHGWGHLQFKVARSTLHIIVLVPAAEK